MQKILYFSCLLILLFIFSVIYFDLVNQNEELFTNGDRTEEVILQNCSSKYLKIKTNQNYETKYSTISLRNNIGNLKCINSISKIDHKNKIVHISLDNGISSLMIYFAIIIPFALKKVFRFRVLFTIYMGIIIFDFYNFGYSFLGYPDIFPIIFLSYFYHEN